MAGSDIVFIISRVRMVFVFAVMWRVSVHQQDNTWQTDEAF